MWSEHIHVRGAETVRSYVDGALAGVPAVTRHAYGEGVGWYAGAGLDPLAHASLIDMVLAETDIRPPALGAGGDVEIVRRSSPEHSFLFIINHGRSKATVTISGRDCFSGAVVGPEVQVAAGHVFVVEEG